MVVGARKQIIRCFVRSTGDIDGMNYWFKDLNFVNRRQKHVLTNNLKDEYPGFICHEIGLCLGANIILYFHYHYGNNNVNKPKFRVREFQILRWNVPLVKFEV